MTKEVWKNGPRFLDLKSGPKFYNETGESWVYPLKHRKNRGFLIFSEGIEREYRHKMVQSYHVLIIKYMLKVLNKKNKTRLQMC